MTLSPRHAFHDVVANYYASNPGSRYSNVHCRFLARESLVLLSLVPCPGSSGFCSMAQLKSMGASSSESEEMAGPRGSTSARSATLVEPLSAFAFPDSESAHKAALAAAGSVLKKPLKASLETTPPAKRSCPVSCLLSTEKGLKPGSEKCTLSKKKPAGNGEGAILGPIKQKPAGAIPGPLKKKPTGAIHLPLMKKPSCEETLEVNKDMNFEADEEQVVEDGKKDRELEEEEEEEEAKEEDAEEEEVEAKNTNDTDLPATFAGRRRPEKNPELSMRLQKFYRDIPAQCWKSRVVKDREFWTFMLSNMSKASGNDDEKFKAACHNFTIRFLQ